MNDANRDSIMKMVADGTLRPEEAAKLLAKLTEEEEDAKAQATAKTKVEANKEKTEKAEKAKPAMEKITIPSADGSERTIEVPSSLMPMIGRMVGEAVKQHTKKVVKESVAGAKIMAQNKYDEVRDTLKTAIKGGKKPKEDDKPEIAPVEDKRFEARRQILQMIQNGRITAGDAGRLIQELDALEAYEEKQAQPPASSAPESGKQSGSKKR